MVPLFFRPKERQLASTLFVLLGALVAAKLIANRPRCARKFSLAVLGPASHRLVLHLSASWGGPNHASRCWKSLILRRQKMPAQMRSSVTYGAKSTQFGADLPLLTCSVFS